MQRREGTGPFSICCWLSSLVEIRSRREAIGLISPPGACGPPFLRRRLDDERSAGSLACFAASHPHSAAARRCWRHNSALVCTGQPTGRRLLGWSDRHFRASSSVGGSLSFRRPTTFLDGHCIGIMTSTGGSKTKHGSAGAIDTVIHYDRGAQRSAVSLFRGPPYPLRSA